VLKFISSYSILFILASILNVVDGSSILKSNKNVLFQTSHSEIYFIDESSGLNIDTIPGQLYSLQSKLALTEDIPTNAINYFSLSTEFLDAQEYTKALDAALIAYYLAKIEENYNLKINSLLIISQINVFWDNPETGISIYEKVDELLTKKGVEIDDQLRLIVLLGKSNAFLKLKNPDEALKFIEEAFDLKANKLNQTVYTEFVWNSGLAFFQKEEFQKALDSIEKVVLNSGSSYFELLSNFYNAQYVNSQGKTEEAISLFLEIDKLLSSENVRFPERKDIYEAINNYFQLKDDRSSQFLYLNKFLIEINYYSETVSYIQKNTSTFFEIPEMIRKKQTEIDLLKTSKNKNIFFITVVTSLLFVALFLLLLQAKRSKLYQKRYKKLMAENFEVKTEKPDSNSQELSVEVISDILQKLEEFEKNKEFLDKNISLHETSKRFNTNSTYLSKVVNLKKDKNFSNYINQLRIKYCLNLLKEDKKTLNYSIRAVAEECGFNTAQSFSNAFYKYTGIYPSYFVEQLKKSEKK
jgi:AraC-like DNA-binding protein